jgi:uncharacterized damage-inducible protein DinB
MIARPAPEDAPAYYQRYLSLVKESELLEAMENSLKSSLSLFASIGKEKEDFRYAADKWTVKEVLSHIADCERIFAYRALRFSRRDSTPLPGFDEKDYAPNANAAGRSLAQIIDEYKAVRRASIELFKYLTPEMLDFRGTANGSAITSRSIGWIIAGHNSHHCNILRERYL